MEIHTAKGCQKKSNPNQRKCGNMDAMGAIHGLLGSLKRNNRPHMESLVLSPSHQTKT